MTPRKRASLIAKLEGKTSQTHFGNVLEVDKCIHLLEASFRIKKYEETKNMNWLYDHSEFFDSYETQIQKHINKYLKKNKRK
jgi:mevalonate pyrophosphate decarboxylase